MVNTLRNCYALMTSEVSKVIAVCGVTSSLETQNPSSVGPGLVTVFPFLVALGYSSREHLLPLCALWNTCLLIPWLMTGSFFAHFLSWSELLATEAAVADTEQPELIVTLARGPQAFLFFKKSHEV